jgi:plastocyanin
MSSKRFRRSLVAVALSALMVLGACADDDDPEETPTEESTSDESPSEESPTAAADVAVTGTDYSFAGLDDTLDAGAKITFKNASAKEAHEIVAFKLPDTETRPAAEIFKLPEAELNAALGGPPVFVIVGPPSSDGMAVVGDGTLNDPGRYVFACFIPTGANPDEYMKAAQEAGDDAPVVAGGPPHFVEGMFAEATVQ